MLQRRPAGAWRPVGVARSPRDRRRLFSSLRLPGQFDDRLLAQKVSSPYAAPGRLRRTCLLAWQVASATAGTSANFRAFRVRVSFAESARILLGDRDGIDPCRSRCRGLSGLPGQPHELPVLFEQLPALFQVRVSGGHSGHLRLQRLIYEGAQLCGDRIAPWSAEGRARGSRYRRQRLLRDCLEEPLEGPMTFDPTGSTPLRCFLEKIAEDLLELSFAG